ncbi:MAG TPA: DNA-3-methyladenine glycosylase [Longimicrobiales bacterium]|nr:DNA-3-methyladenine glycosylase [Longimicrobiales bacterium]
MTGAGLPWQHAWEPRSAFPPGFFARDARTVARDLLGARLVSTVGGALTSGVVVETEAYLGPVDPASHAATRKGVTARNRAMFGPGGRAYVYRSYGVHWCLNVVTGRVGDGEAVLIRGLEPLEGIEVMTERRGGVRPLAAGPGRVAEALGVTAALYGHDLLQPPLRILPGWAVPDPLVTVTGRVGVAKAPEWPLRFLVTGSPGVSRGRAHPGDPSSLPTLPR